MHRALSSRPLVASLSLLSRPPRPTMKRTLHDFFGSGPAVKQRRQALPDTEVATGTAVAAEPASHAETPSAKTAVELRTLANLNAALARRALAAGSPAPLASLLTEASWQPLLNAEAQKSYWKALQVFVDAERQSKQVFPPPEHTFRALNSVPLCEVRVVILGQDPYHGEGQAEGWSFSVPRGQKVPSSLQNIYKELMTDVQGSKPLHGHLGHWVHQGVLLLNTSLTVQAHKAGSHSKKGWETFTDAVISHISLNTSGVVFILWGKHAQTRKPRVDAAKHLVLEGVHPSGLSAHRGFFGCCHFSQCNSHLVARGKPAVDWQIPP